MKKGLITLTIALIAVCGLGFAETLTAYDMADYGTTANITNSTSFSTTLTQAMLTYDSATTNTLAIYVTKDSVDYRLGTSSVTNVQYVTIDLTDIKFDTGDVLKIVTTDTNVVALVSQE